VQGRAAGVREGSVSDGSDQTPRVNAVRARIKESPVIGPNLFSTNASGQQVLRHAHLLLLVTMPCFKKKYYALFSIDCADLTMFISCSDRILAVNFVSQKNLDREFDCCQVMQTVRACTFLVSTLCQILVYLGKNK